MKLMIHSINVLANVIISTKYSFLIKQTLETTSYNEGYVYGV
jgi:hypothetical protein